MTTPFLPSSIPLVPLPPPQVLFPHLRASIPLTSTQLSLVLESVQTNSEKERKKVGGVEGRTVGVVPVLDIDRRVGRWGTAARIKGVEKSKDEDDVYLLIVEGLTRIRLPHSLPPVLSILPNIPLPSSVYSIPLPPLPSMQQPIDLLPFAERLLPSQLHSRLSSIPPTLLADLLVTVLGVSWEHKVEILGIPDVEERCAKVKDFLVEIMLNRGIPPPDEASLNKERRLIKATPISPTILGVGNNPRATSRTNNKSDSMANIPEDLQPIHKLFQARLPELSQPAHLSLTRELARLNKIPPQSAEYGVSKTYVEWILALPWKRVSDKGMEIDLDQARKMLDDEHEGLEKVKRRVVEYLAVYRLKKQLFQEEQEKKKALVLPAPNGDSKVKRLDAEVADNLLELVPASDRRDLEDSSQLPTLQEQEDGPPDDVYRDKGPILLLVGPPGVGKTSIARSLASSLGRKFHRISLGGVRDEAEIRGHRRTYVGALPGLLVQAMRKVGVSNPLILLDELDKVGTSNFHGDPSAALLEALDPAQNWNFHDHYLGDVPIDLSQVLFIATANSLDTMSWPLRDRCEIIECSGYITPEKLAIARRFLLPKQIKESGLNEKLVNIEDGVLEKVITEYTWESGVRSLERELGKVCRTKAVEYSAWRELGTKGEDRNYEPRIDADDVERILGVSHFLPEAKDGEMRPGMVNGLTYDGSGNGSVLVLETLLIPGGNGRLVITGRLGEVFRESIELCLTWVKSRSLSLGITTSVTQDPLKGYDIHYHTPEGAVKKDGPSAGIGTVLAFVSLLTGRPVPHTLAVTGEMSLRGKVLRIGGVKEKTLGAHRSGITKIIMPAGNKKEVDSDVPEQVKKDIQFVFVASIEEAIEEVWGKEIWSEGKVRVDARL
ncbi:ATP-dependent protease La [Kwoniella shandongensis]|uniref:endopeptidase La n=1 Tax=Kwoniella shandongensis TaxID=1734106 RepID=A0A5M6BTJ3_9TREE|nr:ATP-dependent protease La [Kwoniella shandongensis]KAA5525390.1 ATP-dependent protease La [Kwoniella shandongensis]